MSRILAPSGIHSCRLRRSLSVLLLFLMVSDLGYHVADSFLHSADSPAAGFRSADSDAGLPGGCGIPGHKGTPFHHHHFPTLVSQTAMPAPLLAMASITSIPAINFVRSSIITPTGRAPPVRF